MIKIDNLNKSYGERIIFDNFNLSIESGEFVILTGESGSGKTTLLNMMGGIESSDSGQILVDGKDVQNKRNQINFFGRTVGFLFQNFALIEDKTVSENLNIIRKEFRSNIGIEEALKMVGLQDKMNSKVYTLSGGEQQRIALARLMIKQCKVVLADEPTGSLDKNNAEKIMNILKVLNDSGKTIIMVTHDLDLIKYGTRVINL